MEKHLDIKQKTDVQFNGTEKLSNSWMFSYRDNIDKEFKNRYEKIEKEFNVLMDEVYWNKLLYDKDLCEIRFKPVVNHIYHLYKRDKGSHFLSIISPNEWKMEDYIGSFIFNHDGKWIKKIT